jgi:hypothetical protein
MVHKHDSDSLHINQVQRLPGIPFELLHTSRKIVLSNNNLANLESLVILGDKVTSSSVPTQSRSKVRICSSENNSSVDIRMLIHHALETILGFLGCSKPNSSTRFCG